MNYRIYLGTSTCTACGAKHQKIFEIDGKPYGSSCAREILGRDLGAPLWLYELAESWTQSEKDFDYGDDPEDCSINFFNEYGDAMCNRDGSSKLWSRSIKIKGKSVKVDWQLEINDYIVRRYLELRRKN